MSRLVDVMQDTMYKAKLDVQELTHILLSHGFAVSFFLVCVFCTLEKKKINE